MIEIIFIGALIAGVSVINKINFRLNQLEGRLNKIEGVKDLNTAQATPTPQVVPATVEIPVATAPTEPMHVEESQENKLAEGWLPKIGIVAILFGVGFFLKYAIDQGWIGQWARIIIGLVIGTLFIVLGEIWKNRFAKYSQALSGGGAAILYFSFFAAYGFYGLIDRSVAMVLAIIISAIVVTLSLRYVSIPLAFLGVFGAYFSPILFGFGTNPQISLFFYLTIINLAVIAITLKKSWMELLFLSLVGTSFNYMLWAAKYSSEKNTVGSLVFSAVCLIIFLIGIVVALTKKQQDEEQSQETSVNASMFVSLSLLLYLIQLITLLSPVRFKSFIIPMFLAGGLLFYLAHALIIRFGLIITNYSLAIGGTGLIFLGLSWRLEDNMSYLACLIFGTILTLIGLLVIKKEEIRFSGIAVLIVNTLFILIRPYDQIGYMFLFNPKFALLAGQTLVLAVGAILYKNVETTHNEKDVRSLLTIGSSGLLWIAFSLEIINFFKGSFSSNTQNLSLSIWWIVYATILIGLGVALRNSSLRMVSATIFTLAILKVFLYDVQTLNTGYKIVSFISLGAILLIISFIYQKRKEKIKSFFDNNPQTPIN